MVTKAVEAAPYIALNRPQPPALPLLKDRHYHLAYTGLGGKVFTLARWAAAEDAGAWAAAFRSPLDDTATDGEYYLRQFGVDPATGQPQRCKGKGRCAARNPAAGTWLPIIGRLVPA